LDCRPGEVKIAVADNGVGLPADRTAQIFEPFYTTKAVGATVWFSLPISVDTSS